jgi:hypothetical protein
MNKWQIICPVVAFLLVGAVVVVWGGAKQHRLFLTDQAWLIGNDLIESTNSSRVVTVGPSLRARLETFLAHPASVSQTVLGDEPGLGDGAATSRVILTNAVGDKIGIRLRWDGSSEKSDVLGFWTVR